MRRVSGVVLASEAILRNLFSSLSSPRAESLHDAGFFVRDAPGEGRDAPREGCDGPGEGSGGPTF